MDLPNIEVSDAALGESVLPPSYHGRVHEPDDVQGGLCAKCRASRHEREGLWGYVVVAGQRHCGCGCHPDEPEPVECVECDGSGRSQITTKGQVVPIDCPHCHGEGVTEP